ncbi:MAG: SsrA-binding protein SmpB [Patescibacteria group bacterium]
MTYADNPKVRFDYEVLETFRAGLVLTGQEVRSVKTGKVSIKGAYVKILGGEAWLVGATVSPYQPGNPPAGGPPYDPQRSRKLLLKKSELKYLIGKSQEQGLTLAPLKLYDKRGLIKLEIAVARGKKKYDKREVVKRRETERALRRIK